MQHEHALVHVQPDQGGGGTPADSLLDHGIQHHSVLQRGEYGAPTRMSRPEARPRGAARSGRSRADYSGGPGPRLAGVSGDAPGEGTPHFLLGVACRLCRSRRLRSPVPAHGRTLLRSSGIQQRDLGPLDRCRGRRAEPDEARPDVSGSVHVRVRGRCALPVGLPIELFPCGAHPGAGLLLQPHALRPRLPPLVQGRGLNDATKSTHDSADDSRNGSNESFYSLPAVGQGMADLKTVTDTVHGTIRLEPLTLDLLETLALQRLNSIRQLGRTYLVFPGANHSRVEHCLGVGHVAGEMAKALDLAPEERKLVQAAGLLHDVGHGPFSHTLEHVLSRELAVDHMPLTERSITGEADSDAQDDRVGDPSDC